MANQRGRKKSNRYFGPDEEAAVVRFLQCDDEDERNAIYNEWLREPFNTMVESIIRKYKLYRKYESYEHLHTDTLSYLMTKADKFNIESGKKAYSYYGTICKRYILGLLIKDEKKLKATSSYDVLTPTYLESREDLISRQNDSSFSTSKFFKKLIEGVESEMEGDSVVNKKPLNENEIKVGLALIDLLKNWEVTFDSMEGGKKYNKNSILETMRNYTGLTTKDIRMAMKRYKVMYGIIKTEGIEKGFE